MALTDILSASSDDDEDGAEAIDPNPSHDPSQPSPKEDKDSLEEDCGTDYKVTFAAHMQLT